MSAAAIALGLTAAAVLYGLFHIVFQHRIATLLIERDSARYCAAVAEARLAAQARARSDAVSRGNRTRAAANRAKVRATTQQLRDDIAAREQVAEPAPAHPDPAHPDSQIPLGIG